MNTFNSIGEVEAWARQNGGLDGVKEALASGAFGTNPQRMRLAIFYVEREERKIADRLNREKRDRHEREVNAAEQAARASQRSAHEAYISRWIATVAAVVALLAVIWVAFK